MGAGLPSKVTCNGGRYHFEDDQETPDTHVAAFQFPNGAMISWEGRSWGGKRPSDPGPQVVFYGDRTRDLKDLGVLLGLRIVEEA